jgi:hypothetical protein
MCCDLQRFARIHQAKQYGVSPAAPTLGIAVCSPTRRILFKMFWDLSHPLQTNYISKDLTYAYRAKQLYL